MKIDINKDSDYTVISLDGNLDGSSSQEVHDKISPVVMESANIVFEMKNCAYVSSAGLRVLLMAAKQLKKVGGQGVFVDLSPEIEEVMQMTGFDNIFKSYNSIEEAASALGKE